MKTKMKKYDEGGKVGKVTRAEKKEIRAGVKQRVKDISDVLKGTEYSIGPIERMKMRISGNRYLINEAKKKAKANASSMYGDTTPGQMSVPQEKRGGTKMKTGGMVNPNANLKATKVAGSKGVKSGVNPKVSAAKKATGKSSGGVDTPPKKAVPAAKYGRMMKKGGMVKAKKK